MNKIKKAFLLPVRYFSYRFHWIKIYYWSDKNLFKLGNVLVMPLWYYICMFHFYMDLLKLKPFHKLADKGIHTIPYHIRFLAS